jgi:hypothetical protein
MTDDARGDDVYQPPNADTDNPPNDDLDLENALDERDLDALLDEGYSPPERPYAAEDYGTTQEEQERGESLDRRLARERPDPEATGEAAEEPVDEAAEPGDEEQVGGARTGRLTGDPDAEARGNHTQAHDVGIDGGAATAEEAAIHTVPEEDEI